MVVLITCSILIIGLKPLVDTFLGGAMDVGNLPKTYSVDVKVDDHEGSSSYLLGRVILPSTCLVVKPELTSHDKNLTLVVSGTLILRSSNASYLINMPCMIVVGEPCYRVMMLIPGYDTPLCIESSEYDLELTMTWRTSDKGSFIVNLTLYEVSKS